MALKNVYRALHTTAVDNYYGPLTGKTFSGEVNLCNLDSAEIDVYILIMNWAGGTLPIEKVTLKPAGTLGNSARVKVAVSGNRSELVHVYHTSGTANYAVNIFGDEYPE